jgi:hypothetical protein
VSGRIDGSVDRRTVLGTLGAAALTPTLGEFALGRSAFADGRPDSDGTTTGGPATDDGVGATDPDATLRVAAYPRVEHATDRWSGWTLPMLEALGAVGGALDRVATHAQREEESLEVVDWQLDAAAGVSLPGGLDAYALIDEFRDAVRERGSGTPTTCHLLLWSEPLNYEVGYGLATSTVGDDGDGAFGLTNVGATERWDGRAVTRNMAVHETLHTFLSDDIVEGVNGDSCDHNLGSVRHVDGVAEVSPMATSYAGRSGPGSGTTWSGGGCGDHGDFYRHDGVDSVDAWRHTLDLSDGTLDAAARYVATALRGD